MKIKSKIILTLLSLIMMTRSYSQQPSTTNWLAGTKKLNASELWYAKNDYRDSLEAFLPEPLGFIGDTYQRFYIHYTSVIKSEVNPYQYFVQGKTKVRENICNFSGTITIVKAALYKQQPDPLYKEGVLECEVLLYEDSTQNSSGFIKGRMVTKFYLDKKNNIRYDDLMMDADDYFNNQCKATWTSYQTKKSKKCNWGDYRIPDSKALDAGDGEFAVDKKYLMNGWKNYMLAWSGDPEEASAKEAQEKELMHWWDDK